MIGAIVQARLGSTRLPRKVLMEIPPNSGVTCLEWVFRRLQKCKLLDAIVLTTPDADLCEFANKIHMNWIWNVGPRNVMLEYLNTAKQYKITTIVRITADCPLIDPEIVDDVISRHVLESNDYTCNRSDDDGDIGDGLDVEVFQIEALERAYGNSPSEYELEHVTAQFRSNGYKSGSIGAVEFDGCSLDTQEDYDKISEYIRRNKCQFIQMAQAQDGTKP